VKIIKCGKCGIEIMMAKDVGVYRPEKAEQEKIDSGKAVLLYTPMKPIKCLKCGREL